MCSMTKIRYQLKTFLLVTTAIALAIGFYSRRSLQQRSAVNKLIQQNANVYFYVDNDKKFIQQYVATRDDFWNHFVYPVKMVILEPCASSPADGQIRTASNISSLEQLYVWPGGSQKFDNQPEVIQADGGVTDDGLDIIIRDMSNLRKFATTSAMCSNEKIRELDKTLTNAEMLTVHPHKNSSSNLYIKK